MAKSKTTKKSTAGIPRITSTVLAMDEAGRAAWVAGLKNTATGADLSAEQKADITARLSKASAKPRKSRQMDWPATFAGRSAEDLASANAALKVALVGAKSAMEQEIAELEARIEQRKQALASTAGAETVTA